jgi:hypothetical protein
MMETRWRRLVAVLLLGLVLGWPVLGQPMGTSHAAVSLGATMADGCEGCDRQPGEDASCPAVLCLVAPAIVPIPAIARAVTKGRDFPVDGEHFRGLARETDPPPPRRFSQS